MKYRLLGRSGLKVSTLSFGTLTFGGAGAHAGLGDVNGAGASRQIDMCLEAGVNLFDTADVYSDGLAEEQLGKALGSRRNEVLLATKFFGQMGPGINDGGGSRYHIVRACEASLRRLNTDYIDLYQIHNQDSLTPADETLRALEDLIRAGKVRYIGSSNHAGWAKMRALATSDRLGIPRYVSQQIQYSLLTRDAEDELLPLGVAEGVGALVWSPLASGYLTGKFDGSGDPGETRLATIGLLARMDTEHARRVVQVVKEIAEGHPGATPSQVSLNWVARKPGVSSVILGARTDAQLADNLAALDWSLDVSEVCRLDEVSELPLKYPYNMHRGFAADRNPPLSSFGMDHDRIQPGEQT